MVQVFLTSASTSPWARPSDWQDAGHTVELIGAGGNGGPGQTNSSTSKPAQGGSAGAYYQLVYASGALATTTAFAIAAAGAATDIASGDTFATFWEGTTTTNTYEARAGIAGQNVAITGGGAMTGGIGVTNGTPSPVTYTTTSRTGGGVPASGSATLGGVGGGGASGPGGNGKQGGVINNAGLAGSGGGGSNGGTSTAGQTPGASAGGNGGDGNAGTGKGLGATVQGPAGDATAGLGGAGGGGFAGSFTAGATNLVGGAGATDTGALAYNNPTYGPGAGGGGGGSNSSATGAGYDVSGGNGANYGGGGGGAGRLRFTGTANGGLGGGGLAVVTYSSLWTATAGLAIGSTLAADSTTFGRGGKGFLAADAQIFKFMASGLSGSALQIIHEVMQLQANVLNAASAALASTASEQMLTQAGFAPSGNMPVVISSLQEQAASVFAATASFGAAAGTFIFDLTENLSVAAVFKNDADLMMLANSGLSTVGSFLINEDQWYAAKSVLAGTTAFAATAATFIFDLAEAFAATALLGSKANLALLTQTGLTPAAALAVNYPVDLINTLPSAMPAAGGFGAAASTYIFDVAETFAAAALFGSKANLALLAQSGLTTVGNLGPTQASISLLTTPSSFTASGGLGAAAATYIFDLIETLTAIANLAADATRVSGATQWAGSALLAAAGLQSIAERMQLVATGLLPAAAALNVNAATYIFDTIEALNAAALLGGSARLSMLGATGFSGATSLGTAAVELLATTAVMSASGAFAANAATYIFDTTEALNAAALLGGSARLSLLSTAGWTGATTLGATAVDLQAVIAVLSGTGAFSANAATYIFDTIETLNAVAGLGVLANLSPLLALTTLAPSALLGAVSTQWQQAQAGFAGSFTLSANLLPPNVIGAIFAAAANLSSLALLFNTASMALIPVSSLNVTTLLLEPASSGLAGTAAFAAAPILLEQAQTVLPATGLFSAQVQTYIFDLTETMTGAGAAAATARLYATATAAFAATTTLVVNEQQRLVSGSSLTAASIFGSTLNQTELAQVGFAGAATLSAQIYPPNVIGAIFAAASAFAANTSQLMQGIVVLAPAAAATPHEVMQLQGFVGLAPAAAISAQAATFIFATNEHILGVSAVSSLANQIELAAALQTGTAGLGATTQIRITDLIETLTIGSTFSPTTPTLQEQAKVTLAAAGVATSTALQQMLAQVGFAGGSTLGADLLPPSIKLLSALLAAAAVMTGPEVLREAAAAALAGTTVLGSVAVQSSAAPATLIIASTANVAFLQQLSTSSNLAGAGGLSASVLGYIFDAAAALSPAGSLSALLAQTIPVTGSLAPAASLGAIAARLEPLVAAMTAAAVFAATANTFIFDLTETLAATALLAATPVIRQSVAAGMSPVTGLSVAEQQRLAAQAGMSIGSSFIAGFLLPGVSQLLTGAGALAVHETVYESVLASLAVSGVLNAAFVALRQANGLLTGAGFVSGASQATLATTSSLQAQAALVAREAQKVTTRAILAADIEIAATANQIELAAATLAATISITIDAHAIPAFYILLTGTMALTALAMHCLGANISLSSQGAAAVNENMLFGISMPLGGQSQFNVQLTELENVATALSGTSNISIANLNKIDQVGAALDGTGWVSVGLRQRRQLIISTPPIIGRSSSRATIIGQME